MVRNKATPLRDLLLDTHIVIWLASDADRVPPSFLQVVDGSRQCFVSHISALEIQIKHSKSPAAFPFSLAHLEQAMKELSCQELPISLQDIKSLSSMRFHHADPFDRLLMAQAANRNLQFATFDRDILRTAELHHEFQVLTHAAAPESGQFAPPLSQG